MLIGDEDEGGIDPLERLRQIRALIGQPPEDGESAKERRFRLRPWLIAIRVEELELAKACGEIRYATKQGIPKTKRTA